MDESSQCLICLNTAEDTEFQRLQCSTSQTPHTFHKQCLHQWACVSPTCPLCRKLLPFAENHSSLKPDPEILPRLIDHHYIGSVQHFINHIPADNASFLPLINDAIIYTQNSIQRLNYPWCLFSMRYAKDLTLFTAATTSFFTEDSIIDRSGALAMVALTSGYLFSVAYKDYYTSRPNLIHILNLLEAYKNLHDPNN